MRARVAENFLKTETVLYIEGWVPEEEAPEFRSIVRNTCHDGYALEEEEVERDSLIVPIKLKNNKFVKAFESITAMYSMPRYNEIDPTPVLAPFYWLFFGLMAGDIGYGLVLMLGTALALRFFHLKESMRSFMQFFFYLSIAMTLAGFLYGSAFSVTVFTPLPMEGGGYKAILDSNTDIITMLILSIALGVIQIIVGLCVKAYMLLRDGRPFSAIFDSLFFILVLLSGIGLILGMTGMLPETVKTISWWTFWAMLAGLALTQGRESPSIGGKIGNGLYAVYGLTSYVGDIVSYTRIVALALSGAYIGFSFNQLIVQVLPDNLFIKIVFGAAIALIGHLLNFGLSLLSAYVHTCRLQYVEYFGKFYEGGGVPFAPFKLQNTYVQIKKYSAMVMPV
ncbi:V-type ATP synthase subunit I [Oscillospiraceae bacterium OttesenSCG-928-G22]|nr:V-type ATP synthase subunit I [Oscillospiraceae bacterium OttesenSCG-928-G22]